MAQYDETLFNIYVLANIILFVPKLDYFLARKVARLLIMLEGPLVDRMYNNHMLIVHWQCIYLCIQCIGTY